MKRSRVINSGKVLPIRQIVVHRVTRYAYIIVRMIKYPVYLLEKRSYLTDPLYILYSMLERPNTGPFNSWTEREPTRKERERGREREFALDLQQRV